MEFLTEYGMFLAKLMTFVFIMLVIAGGVFLLFMRSKTGMDGQLEVKNLNQKFENINLLLKSQILTKKECADYFRTSFLSGIKGRLAA